MEEKADSKRPENTPFKQQRLPAWQPLLTPMYVIGTFVVVGFIFLPIGIVILTESNNGVEYKARYDNLPSCQLLANERVKTCNVSITIDEHMKRPIYVYYELSNYYQNHRRYVKSRSDQQLRGDLGTGTALCDPIERNVNGSIIVACGLVANSFFNDTFSAMVCNITSRCAPLTGNNWLKKGIAWKSDVEEKFKAVPLPATGFTNISVDGFPLPSVADEDFIVWMRTAGLPRFRKLYRKIEDMDLVASQTITFNVVNRYPVDSFDGTKSIVISTTSWLGGKNNFLGWAYIVVGALCLLMALAFEIRSLAAPRLLGDMKYFDWSGSSVAKTDAEH